MNLLFFPGGTYVGGMEIVIQGLMAELNRMGHRTLAVVSGWNNGDYPGRLGRSGLAFEEVKLGRFYRSKPLWTLDTLRHMPGAVRRLRRLAREFRAEAAIYPDPQLLLLGSTILPGLHNVLYEHNNLSGQRPSPVAKIVNARLHRVVCVSHFVAAGAGSAGRDPAKTVVVHNGVVLPDLPTVRSHDQPVRLGIVGQLLPRKRHLLLVEALDILRARHPAASFRLKIIGNSEGDYAGEVRRLVERLQLQAIVEWSGFFTSRDDIYRDLDVVVAPAIDEPFGMTIIEAGAYGLPVVAARSGGFPEVIVDGTTGFLFEPGKPESLVATLARIVADPALRAQVGCAGRAHVGQTFTMERMAQRFAEAVSP